MKHTDGLFLEVFRHVAAEYADIEPKENLVDAICMGLVQRPEEYDVLVLPNLYGDIVSDLAAGLVGGLGVAPGANIGADAADLRGDARLCAEIPPRPEQVNPIAMILSGKLMLDHLDERAAARPERGRGRDRRRQEPHVRHEARATTRAAVGTSEWPTQSSTSSSSWSREAEKVAVIGAGNVGATCAGGRPPGLRGRRPRRHHPELPAGQGPRHEPGGRGALVRAEHHRCQRLRGDQGL